jgi:kinesin family member 5
MLHSDLQNRVDKVLKLEMQLDEMRDGYKQLESTISKDDLKYMRKALNLEKNLESINQMFQNATSEKSIIQVNLQVAERQIARQKEKIERLEQLVNQSRVKQTGYLNIIKQLKQEFLKV